MEPGNGGKLGQVVRADYNVPIIKFGGLSVAKYGIGFNHLPSMFAVAERLVTQIESAFGGFDLQESGRSIPFGFSWMTKSIGEPALEVADFLVNSIGAEVRHRLAHRPGHAKNFEAFFHHTDSRLVSFVDIRSMAR